MLNQVIHEQARLRIIASLASLELDERVDFSYLKNLLELSDGNLGAHLRVLEKAGYIEIDKAFVDRKPKTFYWLSIEGREAFAEYIKELEEILFKQD